jgi:predicted nucleic acid-binding protein
VPTSVDLGAGEKEVLALGMQLPEAVTILDERLARLHANALNIKFMRTPGILMRAKTERRLAQLQPVLDHVDRLGFRLSAKTRQHVLRLVGE